MSTLNIVDIDDGFIGLGDGGCVGADCCGKLQKPIVRFNTKFSIKLNSRNANINIIYETFPRSCI